MKIQFVGTYTVREFGPYRFNQGETRDVNEVAVIQEMLTQPGTACGVLSACKILSEKGVL